MRHLDFLDRGEISVRINESHFASHIPDFIGFGLNLNLVEFFKVIQCPKFHWIWIKSHETLKFLDSSYKGRYHIYMVGCSKTPIDES